MINTNVSSMMANQVFMDNNAHNVANVNTDGYVPNKTIITEGSPQTPVANTSKATDNGSERSQTDLSKELTDQITIENVQEANLKAIRTEDEMMGSLLDIRA